MVKAVRHFIRELTIDNVLVLQILMHAAKCWLILSSQAQKAIDSWLSWKLVACFEKVTGNFSLNFFSDEDESKKTFFVTKVAKFFSKKISKNNLSYMRRSVL